MINKIVNAKVLSDDSYEIPRYTGIVTLQETVFYFWRWRFGLVLTS